MTRLTVFAIALVGLALMTTASAQATLTGNWTGTLTSPMGPTPLKLVLKHEGAGLTGTIDGPVGVVPLEGTVSGSDVTIYWTVDVGGMSLTITMTGTIDGESLLGDAAFGDFGNGTWEVKRAAATPPAAQ